MIHGVREREISSWPRPFRRKRKITIRLKAVECGGNVAHLFHLNAHLNLFKTPHEPVTKPRREGNKGQIKDNERAGTWPVSGLPLQRPSFPLSMI